MTELNTFHSDGRHAVIHSAELVRPPAHVLEALELPDDTERVIRRERTTYDSSDKKHSRSVSWFDAKLAETCPLLLETGRLIQGTVRYIAEQTGRTPMPNHIMCIRNVEISPAAGDVQMRIRHWYLDIQEVPIEYGESFMASNTEIEYWVHDR